MSFERKTFIFVCFLIVFCILFICLKIAVFRPKNDGFVINSKKNDRNHDSAVPYFTVYDLDGALAVQASDGEITVYSYPISTLPATDQSALRIGITVKTEHELAMLIDDLTS